MSTEEEEGETHERLKRSPDQYGRALAMAFTLMKSEEESEYPHERKIPDNVLFHPKRSQMDIPVVDVLRSAYEAGLSHVVIIGRRKNGREYMAASSADSAESIYYLTRGLHLMNSHMDQMQAELEVEQGMAGPDDDGPSAA